MGKRCGEERARGQISIWRDNVEFNSGLVVTWAVLLSLTVLVMVCRGIYVVNVGPYVHILPQH